MFANSVDNPLCLDRLANDVIRPALTAAGIEWHGWHAFRRGFATNLHGVPDKIIQRILRHANVRVTQDSYSKTADDDAIAAMKQFEGGSSEKTP
jgi:integrase